MVEMACATSAASADCLGHRLNPTGLNGTDSMGRDKESATVRDSSGSVWTSLDAVQPGPIGMAARRRYAVVRVPTHASSVVL